MRIAYFSPLPPHRTGVAVYSARLLPHLAQLADITIFTIDAGGVGSELRKQFDIRDSAGFSGPVPSKFDVCLYQMGSNLDYHEDIFATLRHYPGIVVLHDVNLHSFHTELFVKGGRPAAYIREMSYAYGREGARHARLTLRGKGKHDVKRYPLFERLVNLSLGVIVTSKYAQRIVSLHCPDTFIRHINQPVPVPKAPLPSAIAKANLDYNPDDLLLLSAGFIAPSKRVDVALQAIAELKVDFPHLHYALVGQAVDGYNLDPLLKKWNLENNVSLVGYADDGTYKTYLTAADIGINLRYPSLGETSATLFELMTAGKPVLVTNIDAFAEIPEPVCLKVDAGPNEQAQLNSLIKELAGNTDLRQQIGKYAMAYIRRSCDPASVAQQYIEFISQALGIGQPYRVIV